MMNRADFYRLTLLLRSLITSINQNTEAIQEHDAAAEGPTDPPEEITVEPEVRLPPAIQGYYEAEQRERPSNNRWQRIKRVIETVAFVSALAAALFTYKTLNQVRRQTDIAEAANRPWLKITQVSLDDSVPDAPILSFSPAPTVRPLTAAALRTEFRIKNIGNGVAQHIAIEPNIVFEPWTDRSTVDIFDNAERNSCEYSLQHAPLPTAFTWSAIFPGDEVEHRVVIIKPFTDDLVSHIPKRAGNWLSGAVIACVTYQYPRQYQTRAVFHIMGPKDRFVEIGKSLNASDLHLLRDQHYEYAQ